MRLLLIIILLIPCLAYSQQNTIITDTTAATTAKTPPAEVKEIDSYADRFIPRRASLYAAVLPGAGQIYNKKYWKLPLVYGGLIGLGLAVKYYDDRYQLYRSQYFKILDDPTYKPPSGANANQLESAINRTRRERDFYMILTGVFYLLQIADAHIDAHLKEFDLNPELQVVIDPMFEESQALNYQAGLSVKLRFR